MTTPTEETETAQPRFGKFTIWSHLALVAGAAFLLMAFIIFKGVGRTKGDLSDERQVKIITVAAIVVGCICLMVGMYLRRKEDNNLANYVEARLAKGRDGGAVYKDEDQV